MRFLLVRLPIARAVKMLLRDSPRLRRMVALLYMRLLPLELRTVYANSSSARTVSNASHSGLESVRGLLRSVLQRTGIKSIAKALLAGTPGLKATVGGAYNRLLVEDPLSHDGITQGGKGPLLSSEGEFLHSAFQRDLTVQRIREQHASRS